MNEYAEMGFTELSDGELGWEDEIQHDGDFILLEEGDYDFEIVRFERARHNGSEKLPPCNKAVVHIRVKGKDARGNEEEVTLKHNLFLHTKTEGMLCAFFTAIGQRKRGEKLRMNWGAVVGSKGRCKVGIRNWKNEKGEIVELNEIKKFYEPEEARHPSYQAGDF